jgi:hypothetical protein
MHELSLISMEILFNAFNRGPGISNPYLNYSSTCDLLYDFKREHNTPNPLSNQSSEYRASQDTSITAFPALTENLIVTLTLSVFAPEQHVDDSILSNVLSSNNIELT